MKTNIKTKFAIAFVCIFFAGFLFADSQQLYQKGAEAQAHEEWYSAIEFYQTALKENPSYNLVYQGLAECFYALNEYDQALEFVQKARKYRRDDSALQNLHGFILIGLKDLKQAQSLFNSVLKKYPNDAEARFGLAEIEVFQGKLFVASDIYKQALQRQGENRKALLSLALISFETGKIKIAENYIKKALEYHGDNPQVHYFAAYLSARSGDFELAEGRLNAALKLKENYDEARALLASVLYSQKRYEAVIKICDLRISKNRNLSDAWYLKALSLLKLNDPHKAITSAKVGLSIDPNNEILRSLLEELAIKNLDFEDKYRAALAKYHSDKGQGFLNRNITEQALYEFRRALKIYPYSISSREAYAGILLRLGYPERYFEQMSFIQNISKSNKRVNDAVEAFNKILLSSIQNKWKIDPLYLDKAHISIGLFYGEENTAVLHPEVEKITQIMASDILSYNSFFKINSHSEKPFGYKDAFAASRKAGDDYFGIIKLQENERDIQITLELFVSRTGSPAKTFSVSRSGNDKFSNALRQLSRMLINDMPLVGKVINRYQNEAVIDIGKYSLQKLNPPNAKKTGNKNELLPLKGVKIAVVKKGGLKIKKSGLGFDFEPPALLGFFEPKKCDENLCEGFLKRNGYYDRMNAQDEIIFIFEDEKNTEKETSSDLEQNSFLYLLLRKIR